MKRVKWSELSREEKAQYDWVDLEPGETMAQWWEAYQDAIEEDERS